MVAVTLLVLVWKPIEPELTGMVPLTTAHPTNASVGGTFAAVLGPALAKVMT